MRAQARRLLVAGAIVAASGLPAPAESSGRAPQSSSQELTPLTLQMPELPRPTAAAIGSHDLEQWAGDWFRKRLGVPGAGAPGAIVAIVQADRILLARGFGVADLASRAPVTAETVFRAGSVSKPLTVTALMQLVEAGRIDVRAPVNRYLHDMQVPVAFGRPVAIFDLVTHTGGFDVRLEGTAATSDGEIEPLGVYLRGSLPPQVRRSGEVLSYSNHGYALLGHVVEQVSGESFETYMGSHVFGPLGMRHSSFRLSREAEARAATGYEPSGSGFRKSASVHPRIYPAAGLNTTGDDMARFLLAQLNGGRGDGAAILSEASIERMHRQQFAQSPAMPGVALGFFENVTRGERALVQAGGIRGFMSGLCLWPRYRLGLFVSNNGYSGSLVQDFLAAFVERYFPRPTRASRGVPADVTRLERFTGVFRAATAARGTLERVATLFGGDVEIRAVGGYRPHLDFGGDAFVPAGRLDFVLDRGDEPLAFTEDRSGKVARLVSVAPLLGCEVFEKVRWYQASRLHRELLALFCAVFLSVLLAPLASRLEWRAQPAGGPTDARRWLDGLQWRRRSASNGRLARALLFLVTALDVLFLVLMAAAFRLARDGGLLYGVPPLARFDLRLSAIAALLALVLPFCAWRAWQRGYWSTAARVHYSTAAAAALAFVGFLSYWNLLGY